jgi:hypothetical protein
MEAFQKIVLTVAVVFLLICLIVISILLIRNKKHQLWPPLIGDCPDYWMDMSGNGAKCVNVKNLGTCGTKEMDFTVSPYSGSGGNCQKYNWAAGCNVSWDGITYGTQYSPCDPSYNSTSS